MESDEKWSADRRAAIPSKQRDGSIDPDRIKSDRSFYALPLPCWD
jgi:hypothetical protein